jgi:hypothetical protein
MTESDQEFGPNGSTEADRVDAGPATEVDPQERARAARTESRPDLDARQRRLSTSRRPMGPQRRSEEERTDSRAPQEDEVEQDQDLQPTDPDSGEG